MTHRPSTPSQPPLLGLSREVSISSFFSLLNTQIPEPETSNQENSSWLQHLYHPGRRLPKSEPHHRVFDLQGLRNTEDTGRFISSDFPSKDQCYQKTEEIQKKKIRCDRSERKAGPNTFLEYLSLWRSIKTKHGGLR